MNLLWTSVLGLATVALAAGCDGSLNGPGGGSGGGSGVAGARGPTQGTGGGTGSAGFPGGSFDASYGLGGSGGENDGGDADGGSSCIATFSGGLSMTFGCNVSVFFESSGNTSEFSITFTSSAGLPGTTYGWISQVLVPGQPRTGTFEEGSGISGDDFVSVPLSDPPQLGAPNWQATFWASDAEAMVGSLTVTITSLGPVTPPMTLPSYFYHSPHGTANATLVDTATGMPDIIQTVTF